MHGSMIPAVAPNTPLLMSAKEKDRKSTAHVVDLPACMIHQLAILALLALSLLGRPPSQASRVMSPEKKNQKQTGAHCETRITRVV
jgi:hypothetical protein